MDPWVSILLQILLIVILLVLTAFFSGAETAIESCNQFKFRVKANEGNKNAKLVVKTIDKFSENIISVLIGYNVTSTIMSTVSTVLFVTFAGDLANVLSTVVIAVCCYIFSDTLPKIVARTVPDKYLSFSVYPLFLAYYLFFPLIKFFALVSNLFKKMLKIKEDVTLTEEDFSNVVDFLEDEGKLDEDETDVIQNALEFDDITVKECFTPKSKMSMINIEGATNQEVNEMLLKSEFSRLPVYEGDEDNIIGILNVKQYFNEYMEDKHVSIPSILNDVYFIEPNTMIDDLFEGFKKNKTHIAIVRSKEGKVLGMITMDDVLEELVGEMTSTNLVKEVK